MKKSYSAPIIQRSEYAQFENVYTAGCTKQYTPTMGWELNCSYFECVDPADPRVTLHMNITGS